MGRRPWIANARTAAILGVGLFVVSCLILYDAYDRRGGKAPRWISVFTPL